VPEIAAEDARRLHYGRPRQRLLRASKRTYEARCNVGKDHFASNA
jgi:hypothetical protein